MDLLASNLDISHFIYPNSGFLYSRIRPNLSLKPLMFRQQSRHENVPMLYGHLGDEVYHVIWKWKKSQNNSKILVIGYYLKG